MLYSVCTEYNTVQNNVIVYMYKVHVMIVELSMHGTKTNTKLFMDAPKPLRTR